MKKASRSKSIISDDVEGKCFLCGGRSVHVHHIFGGPCRKASDKRKLIVHLCFGCHEHVHSSKGGNMMLYLHQIGQRAYEEQIGTREEFRQEFIRSYL